MNSTINDNYDLLVVGAGSGGLTAAEFGATLGAKVALIEADDRLGGECLHAGCVPSKTLIHAARRFQTVREHVEPSDDLTSKAFHKAMVAIKTSIDAVEAEHDNDAYYQKRGVIVFHGRANFSSSRTLKLDDGRELSGKRIIIATGSKPLIPAIPGLNEIDYLTNENIFNLTELPASLIVIGGGPIGCELGQALAMFGCHVTIISQDDRLLPRDEPEASAALRTSLETYDNVTLIFNAKVTGVTKDKNSTVHYEINGQPHQVSAERVLVATGRAANTDLNLSAAGIEFTDKLIITNDRLQTTNSNVYAIGDVMGGPNFTHVAGDQAVIATQNALLRRKRTKSDIGELSWATFTTPEIAHLGADEASLNKIKIKFTKQIIDYRTIDKAVAEHEAGQIKILADARGHLLGVTVIGGPAAELIGLFALAKHKNLTISDLGSVLQAYPTYSFGVKLFAAGQTLATFNKGIKRQLITVLRKIVLR